MKRRLATLAAAAALVLALGATPVAAAGRDDHWTVTRDSQSVAGLVVTCGKGRHANTYTVLSGTSEFVMRTQGRIDSGGFAKTDGQGIETWTLRGVTVADQHHHVHRVTGSQQISAAWQAGADVNGNPGGPWLRFTWDAKYQVDGTSDGYTFNLWLLKDGSFGTTSSGSCPSVWG
jgi:hypothetical protein